MMPDTSNTQVRAVVPSTQAFRDPEPLAARLVTLYTVPPRPAGVSMPKPAAPGMTGTACAVVAPSAARPRANRPRGFMK